MQQAGNEGELLWPNKWIITTKLWKIIVLFITNISLAANYKF